MRQRTLLDMTLSERRRAVGTLEAVAALLHCSRSYLHGIETGRRYGDDELCGRFAALLGLMLEQFRAEQPQWRRGARPWRKGPVEKAARRPVRRPADGFERGGRTPGLYCACGSYKGPTWPVCESCAARMQGAA